MTDDGSATDESVSSSAPAASAAADDCPSSPKAGGNGWQVDDIASPVASPSSDPSDGRRVLPLPPGGGLAPLTAKTLAPLAGGAAAGPRGLAPRALPPLGAAQRPPAVIALPKLEGRLPLQELPPSTNRQVGSGESLLGGQASGKSAAALPSVQPHSRAAWGDGPKPALPNASGSAAQAPSTAGPSDTSPSALATSIGVDSRSRAQPAPQSTLPPALASPRSAAGARPSPRAWSSPDKAPPDRAPPDRAPTGAATGATTGAATGAVGGGQQGGGMSVHAPAAGDPVGQPAARPPPKSCLTRKTSSMLSDTLPPSGASGRRLRWSKLGLGLGLGRSVRSASALIRWDAHLSPLTSHLSPLAVHLSPCTSHLSPLAVHLSPLTSHLSPPTSHLSPLAVHLSPLTSHLSPLTSHLSPCTSHLSPLTSHLSPLAVHLSPLEHLTLRTSSHLAPHASHVASLTARSPAHPTLTPPGRLRSVSCSITSPAKTRPWTSTRPT